MERDESFKKEGAVPFKWEIRPGTPKAQHQPCNNSSTKPPQKLRPPPAGFYFYPPVELGLRSVRSAPRSRSERMRFDRPGRPIPLQSGSVSSGCFPTPMLKRKGAKKKNNDKAESETEFDYASDLETLSRFSTSTRKSLSPFHDSPSSFFLASPSSFSSVSSSPRAAGDAEWAAFGLF